MSLRWRDELRLLLTPQRVYLRRYARGLRPLVVEDRAAEVPVSGGTHWSAAVETLAPMLAASPRRGADAQVIVSNHYARFTRVPANDLLVTHDDELRYAQQDFVRVYGSAAERWHVTVSSEANGGGALASGIDTDLAAALRAVLAAHGLRPRSLQPALMAVFNAGRATLPASALRLIVIEPGMAVSALLNPGWSRIRSQRLAGAGGDEIDRIVQHERALDDEPIEGETVCVAPLRATGLPAALGDGTLVHPLAPFWSDDQHAQERAA